MSQSKIASDRLRLFLLDVTGLPEIIHAYSRLSQLPPPYGLLNLTGQSEAGNITTEKIEANPNAGVTDALIDAPFFALVSQEKTYTYTFNVFAKNPLDYTNKLYAYAKQSAAQLSIFPYVFRCEREGRRVPFQSNQAWLDRAAITVRMSHIEYGVAASSDGGSMVLIDTIAPPNIKMSELNLGDLARNLLVDPLSSATIDSKI